MLSSAAERGSIRAALMRPRDAVDGSDEPGGHTFLETAVIDDWGSVQQTQFEQECEVPVFTRGIPPSWGGGAQLQIPPAQATAAEACSVVPGAEPSQLQIPPSQPRDSEACSMGAFAHVPSAPSAPSTPADRGPSSSEDEVDRAMRAALASVDAAKDVHACVSAVQEHFERALSATRAEEDAEKKEEAPYEAMLAKALKAGEFDIRDALGQRFQKAHKPGSEEHGKLKQCKTWAEKKAFRQAWASTQYQELRSSRTWSKSWKTIIDRTKGTHMPLARIIEKEGFSMDSRGATAAGLALARKCLRLGGEWVLKDDFTGSVNFLKLRKEFQEEMEESWAMCMQETTRGQGGSVGAGGSASPAGESAAGTGADAGKGGKAAASQKKTARCRGGDSWQKQKGQSSDAEGGCGVGGGKRS